MRLTYPHTEIPDHPLLNLTRVQKMRMEGKTRRALVSGKNVTFQYLSPHCTVNPTWDSKWPAHYKSNQEAKEAARIWETEGEIMKFGFTGAA